MKHSTGEFSNHVKFLSEEDTTLTHQRDDYINQVTQLLT